MAVVIPALHRPDLTRRCIDSLQKQTIPGDELEVIVVENQARPESILPDPLPRHVRRIELRENYGTTGSINRGVALIRSEYVLLLNNDVELEPVFLANLLAAIEQDERCGFVTGKLLSARERTRLDGAGDALLRGGGAFRIGHGDLDCSQFDQRREVLAGCGAATLFRSSAFEQAGGLDEDLFAYLDDMDLCLRTHLIGFRGLYIPQAIAYHLGSATLGSSLHPRVLQWMTQNQILILVKDYPFTVLLRCFPRILAFQLLWFVLVMRRRRFTAYMKGLLGVLPRLPRILRKRIQLMKRSRLSSAAFNELLGRSEAEIRNWHFSRDSANRSRLLSLYFRLFPSSRDSRSA